MIHYSMCVCVCLVILVWFWCNRFFPILFISCWSSFNLQQTKSWDLHCQHQRHRSLSPLSFIMSASTTPQADLCSCKFWQLQKLADTANNNVNLRTHILIKQKCSIFPSQFQKHETPVKWKEKGWKRMKKACLLENALGIGTSMTNDFLVHVKAMAKHSWV